MRVNTRYINSTKGTSSKKDAPSGIYIPISSTIGDIIQEFLLLWGRRDFYLFFLNQLACTLLTPFFALPRSNSLVQLDTTALSKTGRTKSLGYHRIGLNTSQDVRMPIVLFFSETQNRKCDRGAPKQRHKDQLKRQLVGYRRVPAISHGRRRLQTETVGAN